MIALRSSMLAILILLAMNAPARADEEASERARLAHGLARELMSPYCPGRTLADCPSPDAAALRAEIRELVDEGESLAEIRAQLDARFGDAIVGVPRGAVGWFLPGIVLLLGAGVVVVALRRLTRQPNARPPLDPTQEAELDRKLGL